MPNMGFLIYYTIRPDGRKGYLFMRPIAANAALPYPQRIEWLHRLN